MFSLCSSSNLPRIDYRILQSVVGNSGPNQLDCSEILLTGFGTPTLAKARCKS